MNIEDALKRQEENSKKKLDIRKTKGHDYANVDCLANFKVRSDLFKVLKEYNMEPDMTTPQGVAMWDVIQKVLRILNLDKKTDKAKNESIEDSHIDLENYSELASECRLDHQDRNKKQSEPQTL